MPLTRVDGPGRWCETDRMIRFACADERAQVPCRVTPDALELLAGKTIADKDRLAVFEQHRAALEAIAGTKWDRGYLEADAEVLLTYEDVERALEAEA